MKDSTVNIKKVLFVFLLLFIGLISYLTYFELSVAPNIVDNPGNKRLWAQRNEVLRGTIYDRDMVVLSDSKRIDSDSQKRLYKGGSTFAQVLGYVDEKYGITGLERLYDSELMAQSFKFNFFGLFGTSEDKNGKVGNNLVTTLDSKLQNIASDALGYRKGAVVVLNPQNGEVLALVSKPTYNPNNLSSIWKSISTDSDRPLLNRAVAGLYPPGSTFKTITLASALDNLENIETRAFNDKGKLVFNDKESISNYNGEVLGKLTLKGAYTHSSNVVFGSLGLELGNKTLKSTAEKFLFNKDIPADGIIIDNSRFPEYAANEIGNIAQSAIGQSGVLATPMEMALVAATIANGGIMMEPHVVKSVTNSDGKIVSSFEPKSIGQIISSDTAKTISEYMRSVVTIGTGTAANISGFYVCGKTGTADHSSDDKSSAPHSWFIAFAPQQKPTVALAVIVEDGGTGGGAAAQVARRILEACK